ncbi:hypothetical protein AOQ84DRAFT_434418 [Glonium stellatum]|uniref:BTB domain-containing protein n=1 Tax=Glonium stellatum TaxID=574774 RepID=A0A8E2EPH2_9PEZI|nr:hypothetical protein AOQ84DRAFT_434418 [Glonium stellatum]
MDNLFERIFTSDQFTFFVGKGKKPIVLHAAAIAEQSPALNTLINGGMAEAKTKSVNFDDVLEEDFIRFCQFAYMGDYTTPPCIIEENTSGISEIQPKSPPPPPPPVALPDTNEIIVEADVGWAFSSPSSKKSKYSKKGIGKLAKLFDDRVFSSILPRQRIINLCEPISNSDEQEDYTPVFLAHARLYVFADKYGIESLKSLSLQKLHKTLKNFTLYRARVGDILKLVQYAYEHTADYGNDSLRVIVAEYILCEIDTIGKTRKFSDLMEEGGAFVRDFWKLLQQHVL